MVETLYSDIKCKNELFQLVGRLNNPTRFFKFKTEKAGYLYDTHTQYLSRFDAQDAVVLWAKKPEDLEGLDCEALHKRLSAICMATQKKITFTPSSQAELKLSLSTLCNLDCSYCFRTKDKAVKTDVAIAEQAIDFMINQVRPDAKGYSVCVNMTSEPFVEMDAMEQILKYITRKGSLLFEKEDFDDIQSPWDLLNVLPICFTEEFNDPLQQDFEGAVACLNQIISRPDMAKRFPLIPGMSFEIHQTKNFLKTADLTPNKLREFNRRFLALIFPHLNWDKPFVSMSCLSNGTTYNERALAFIKQTGLTSFCISLDGPDFVQNAKRYYKNGEPTYEKVIDTIRKMQGDGISVVISAVITPDFPEPLQITEHFRKLGVSAIDLKPVRIGTSCSFSMTSMEHLLDRFDDLFEKIFQETVSGDHTLINLLKNNNILAPFNLMLTKKRFEKRCLWGEQIVVDGKGDAYPCDYTIGMPDLKIGSINSIIDPDYFTRDLSVTKRHGCSTSWCRGLCGGTCYYGSMVEHGDIGKNESVECVYNKGIIKHNLRLLGRFFDAGLTADLLRIILAPDFQTQVETGASINFPMALAARFTTNAIGFSFVIEKVNYFLEKNRIPRKPKMLMRSLHRESNANNPMFDFDLVIEIEKPFTSSRDYSFIRDFSFQNCLFIKAEPDQGGIPYALKQLQEYMQYYHCLPIEQHYIMGTDTAILGSIPMKETVEIYVPLATDTF